MGNQPNNDAEEEVCPVCLVDYEDGDKIRTLPCGHYFHKDCIDSWLQNNSSCPTCRFSLYDNGNATTGSTSVSSSDTESDDNSTPMARNGPAFLTNIELNRRAYVNNMFVGRRRRLNNR